MFSGVFGENVARCRSWAVAEMGVWRRQDSGGMAKAAVGWPPAEAGDWGAERAHLARAVQARQIRVAGPLRGSPARRTSAC
jgi:hypothetical protein